ncbi:MAG: DUF4349 domain-containing protein [Candidatus Promineifilaceae bacterium]|nr:DUF4349 domain-containing protein [Candidatus Promineifilaceae bacterium]
MRRRLNYSLALLLLALLVLVACGGGEFAAAPMADEAADSALPASMADEAADSAYKTAAEEMALAPSEGRTSQTNFQQQTDVQERLIIRTGTLDIVVADSEEAAEAISRLADRLGGWVVSSNLRDFDGAKSGSITVRVPAAEFDRAVSSIKELATEVEFESTTSEDVTEEYVDLNARLDNLEATAERVRGFLDRARDVEDALDVNQELSRLESEIESLKGRIQFLQQSAAFSTLTVNLKPDALNQPLEVAGWRPQGVARDAIEALVAALQGLANVVIWLVIFVLPILLVFLVPLYLIYRFGWRRWRRRANEGGLKRGSLFEGTEEETPTAESQEANE